MVVVCPVCREVVHTSNGCILLHGTTNHCKFEPCSGSYSSINNVQGSDVESSRIRGRLYYGPTNK